MDDNAALLPISTDFNDAGRRLTSLRAMSGRIKVAGGIGDVRLSRVLGKLFGQNIIANAQAVQSNAIECPGD